MRKSLALSLVALAFTSNALAQDGPLSRAGQALDNAGKNIRRSVEGAVARGQITAQERELLGRVSQRLNFDKQMAGSALRLTVSADGAVVLQGSVAEEAARKRAVDLVQSTVGVTVAVDELAVVKDVRVIQAAPVQIIDPLPVESRVVVPPSRVVVPPGAKVVVPPGTQVIEKR